ncbi:MAG: DevR family CRISPR-associated autoregulator [Thermosphaera sp.]
MVHPSIIYNLSVSARVLVNAEALNMAESVGNYTRHRKAPIIVQTEKGYSVIYVPAVSGESLAHAYQQVLAHIANQRGLPVTKMDLEGYFMKFSDDDIIENYYSEIAEKLGVKPEEVKNKLKEIKQPGELEKLFVKSSVVADVGGFLFTKKSSKSKSDGKQSKDNSVIKQLKRTSAIRFSYLLPSLDAVQEGGAVVIPQLHVRYTPQAKKDEQALFYVESGSALYTLTTQLVISDIARLNYSETPDPELEGQRVKRVEAAIDALTALVDGLMFGAKRSRYMPQWDVRSIVVAFSRGPVEFNVSPGLSRDYIKKTYERAVTMSKIINNLIVNIYAYNGEGLEEPGGEPVKQVTFDKASSPAEAFAKAKDKIINILAAIR